MASIMGAKAISLVQRGGVEERPHARVFRVESSTPGTKHTVVVSGGEPLADPTCTCIAGEMGKACYHVAAVRLVMARERREREGGTS